MTTRHLRFAAFIHLLQNEKTHISKGEQQSANSSPSPENSQTVQGSVQTPLSPALQMVACQYGKGNKPFLAERWLPRGLWRGRVFLF